MIKRCNGIPDCSDGSDEQNCNPSCSQYMDFVCKDKRRCLHSFMVCDGAPQCEDGSDEDPNYAHCCRFTFSNTVPY
ncbi:hypothetical protein chiPu_0027558 [Chiloscyllium punctatum]|uniref:Uncharacterized protein n=1 Tax=Chiloscyllium punctatum TaxID=137246 RepID=A0A401TLM9_CHIPU|nr:hypothetical protein [Chiloscyllium punctatum]